MMYKTAFALLFVILVGTGVLGYRFYSQLLAQLDQEKPVATGIDETFGWKYPVAKFPTTGNLGKLLAYSDIRDPGGTPQGLPVRLKIPAIGVNSAIEDAFITPDGRMDVPAGTKNVAWFALGPKPGLEGSAVIGGHYGFYQANKGPTVFYNLDKLGTGDKVYIEDDSGNTLAFIVRRIQLFDRNADATTVFTSNDGLAHLNLITCEGAWNQVNDSYPDRRVVFTDAIPAEGAVQIQTQEVAVKPKTKAKTTSTPTQTPSPSIEPTITPTPDELITPSSETKLPLSPQILIASAKSLYAAPLDGFITLLLLASIIFMSIKIFRR